jgi:hypothetical protein
MPRLRTRSPFKRGPPPRLIVAMPAAERAGQRRTGGDVGRHAGSRSLGPASGRESDEPSSSVRAGRTAPHRSGLNPSCAMPRPATQQRTPGRMRPRMRRVRNGGGGGDEPVYADRDDAGADPPCPAVLRTSCDTSHAPPIWARTSFAVRDGRRHVSMGVGRPVDYHHHAPARSSHIVVLDKSTDDAKTTHHRPVSSPEIMQTRISSTQAGQDDHSQIFLKARTDFTPAGRGQRAGLQSAESPQEVRRTSVSDQHLPTAPNGKPAGQSSHLLG